MRKTLSAIVIAAATAGFATSALAGCGGMKSAGHSYETASSEWVTTTPTTKPVQQTQVPTSK